MSGPDIKGRMTLFSVFFLSLLTLAAPQFAPVTGHDVVTGEDLARIETGKKGTVVVFLSARCPCSNSHIDELKALAKDHPDYRFVGVHSNRDEDASTSHDYFKKAGLPFPVLQDEHAALADRFKALKTPHAFLFTESGERVYAGGVSDSHNFPDSKRKFLREALDDLSKGGSVRTSEGRTLGCIIQR